MTPTRESSQEEGAGPPVPRTLCDVRAVTAPDAVADASAGALWRLAEPGRQLDANVVHLPARQRVDPHTEPELDVLLLVVGGDGTLGTADDGQRLAEGALLWLPHGAARALTAGPGGLSYLTVHRRRQGLRIGPPPS